MRLYNRNRRDLDFGVHVGLDVCGNGERPVVFRYNENKTNRRTNIQIYLQVYKSSNAKVHLTKSGAHGHVSIRSAFDPELLSQISPRIPLEDFVPRPIVVNSKHIRKKLYCGRKTSMSEKLHECRYRLRGI